MSKIDFALPATLADAAWLLIHLRRGSFFQRPDIGSDLHLLRNDKATPATPGKAESMARRALQPLIDQGRATSVAPSAFLVSPTSLQLGVRINATSGKDVDLTTFVPVGVVP